MNSTGPAAVSVKMARAPGTSSAPNRCLLALALALLPSEGAAAVADAGVDAPLRVASVRRATAELDDGRMVELDGGAWLSDEVLLDRARDLERLAAENSALKRQPPPPPPAPFVVTLILVAVASYLGGLATPRP